MATRLPANGYEKQEVAGCHVRYTIRFMNAQYMELVERFLASEDYSVPEGTYRSIDVVVEARGPEEALALAIKRLQWPDDEMSLVPMGITSDLDARAGMDRMRSARAIMDLWNEVGLIKNTAHAAKAVGVVLER